MLVMVFRAIAVSVAMEAPIQLAAPPPVAHVILDHGLRLWLGLASIAMPAHGLLSLEPRKLLSAIVAMRASIQR